MKVSAKQRMIALLRQAGTQGVSSLELRKSEVTGAPSQRAKDLRSEGWNIYKRRENRGKSPGVRFWIAPYQPAGAELVTPNPGFELGGSTPPEGSASTHAAVELDAGDDVAVSGGTAIRGQREAGASVPHSELSQAAADPDADGGRLFSLPSPESARYADPEESGETPRRGRADSERKFEAA